MKSDLDIKNLGEVCDVFAGGDVPKIGFSKIKSEKYIIPIFSNGAKNKGLYGYTVKARVTKPSITVSARGTIGYSEIRNEAFYPAIRLIVITPKDYKLLDLQYLQYLLSTLHFKHSGSSIPQLTVPMIKKYEIPLINIEDQKRIVSKLNDIFQDAEKTKEIADKNLQNSINFLNSYLLNIFSNTTNCWQTLKLEDVTTLITRGISPKYIETEGLCVLNQRCVRNHTIDFSYSRTHNDVAKKVSSDKLLKEGDILVNSTGVGTLGRVAQVKSLIHKATVDSHVTIVRPNTRILEDSFFEVALIYRENEIENYGMGASGQIELSRQVLRDKVMISFPTSKMEQKKIASMYTELTQNIEKLANIYRTKVLFTEELKNSVLNKAFSGEL